MKGNWDATPFCFQHTRTHGKKGWLSAVYTGIRERHGRQRGRLVRAPHLKSAVRRSRVQIPFWPWAYVVLGSPEFNFSATLVNSQLVCLPPAEILNQVMFIWIFIIVCLHWSLKAPIGCGQLPIHFTIFFQFSPRAIIYTFSTLATSYQFSRAYKYVFSSFLLITYFPAFATSYKFSSACH